MSSRNTPAPRSHSRLYDTPQSTPPSLSQNPSSTSLSRRSLRASSSTPSSLPLQLPPFPRLSSRKPSQASTSGTSTPDAYRKRLLKRAQEGNTAENGEDWAGLEPDEVFRRLPVGEVRKVEGKMRKEAMGKQSELRSMVGARYREVLTSATHVTTLYDSSSRLSSSLRTVAQACKNPGDIPLSAEDGEDSSVADDAVALLPVAAHLKLLLDAPEALYSYLTRHEYLHAAFLWLVTRVVKENLGKMPEDLSAPYLPLLQKQWDVLLPFRAQIVSRATASLRSRHLLDASTLSQTLLAIILLDNLPLPDVLALLLSQRTKTVRDILSHHEAAAQSVGPSLLSAKKSRRRASSVASTGRRDAREREHITRVLREAVQSLLDTVSSVRAAFGDRHEIDESLIQEMIRLIQVSQPAPQSQSSQPSQTSSHQRRASRLASISLPVSNVKVAGGPLVSASSVISTLPSAQILLRYLPAAITTFTPFISSLSSSSSSSFVAESLEKWQKSAVGLLKEAVPSWLSDLGSVSDVWHVRGVVIALLEDGAGGFQAEIRSAIEEEWGRRVRVVWKVRLEALVKLAEEKVKQTAEEIQISGKEEDLNPESYLFSDLVFPSAPSLSIAPSMTLAAFTSTLKKRSAFRTPLLDSVLGTLEASAQDIKKDMQGLPASLSADYAEQVKVALKELVGVLQTVLEGVSVDKGSVKDGVGAEMFVGRVGLFLARSSGFLGDLAGSGAETTATVDSLLQLHAASVKNWHARSVEDATLKLAPIFEPIFSPSIIRASWQAPQPTQPSSQIFTALHALVGATRLLGIPPGVDLPIAKELVEGFVESARALDGWSGMTNEGAMQGAVDLAFLGLLAGEQVGKDAMVQKLVAKAPEDLASTFKDDLASIVAESLRRTQLLLAPLVAHLPPDILPPAPALQPSFSDARGGLLRFGPPGGGKSGEFRSPVAVAKPGKRFGLLSVGV